MVCRILSSIFLSRVVWTHTSIYQWFDVPFKQEGLERMLGPGKCPLCCGHQPGLDFYWKDPTYSVQLIVSMLMVFGTWETWLWWKFETRAAQGVIQASFWLGFENMVFLSGSKNKVYPHDKDYGDLQWLSGYDLDYLYMYLYVWILSAVAAKRYATEAVAKPR